jgi:hypothetical protein
MPPRNVTSVPSPWRTPGFAFGLALLLQGCAGFIPGNEDVAVPAQTSSGEGSVQVRTGRPGIVIGAPNDGVLDENTDLIAGDLARLTGFGLVVVKERASAVSDGRAFAGDRAPGTPARFEPGPQGARVTDEAYRRHLALAAQGPLDVYVEIDGNGPGAGAAARVDIRTVGLSGDDAWRLRTLFELIRDSRLYDSAVPRLEVQVESVDSARATIPASSQTRMRAAAPRALRIELPPVARTTYREIYTKVLGAFLSESVTVLMPKAR